MARGQDVVSKSSDLELLCWLVDLGQVDREQYREIRALMWSFYIENSGHSEKPSNFS